VTIVVAGATLGFLFFNFNPASIFLGDSGSLFLGFMLAGLGLLSSQKSQTIVAVAIPVLSLGLPVLDTALAIMRRFLRGQPIFSADRGHIHHRLLGLGHSPRKVALLLYGVCAVMAFAAMLLVNHAQYIALVLVVCGLGVGVAVQRLRFHEFEELARIMRKSMRQREAIGRSVRIRELSQTLSEKLELGEVFDGLEAIFAADSFERVEIRLRPAFITGERVDLAVARRAVDDVTVWAWTSGAAIASGAWEIRLPLLDTTGERIGALALWQDCSENDMSLSHLPTIARDLRTVVQAKVTDLWHASGLSASTPTATPTAETPVWDRAPRAQPDRRRVTGESAVLRDVAGSRTSAA
jgi:Glycosyl transferase family 4